MTDSIPFSGMLFSESIYMNIYRDRNIYLWWAQQSYVHLIFYFDYKDNQRFLEMPPPEGMGVAIDAEYPYETKHQTDQFL